MNQKTKVDLLDVKIVSSDVHEVMQAAYQIEEALLGLEDFFPLRRTAADIRQSVNDFYGIWREDRLLAVCEMEREGQAMLIASTVVHPDAFRQGLASALLAHILVVYEAVEIHVSTAVDNGPAVSLYKKHGFVVDRYETLPDGLTLVKLHHSKR